MTGANRLIASGAVIAAVAGGVAWGGWTYKSRGAAVSKEIKRYRDGLDARDIEVMRLGGVTRLTKDRFASSLGTSEEAVSADMRTALNEMLANVGLRDPSVTTRGAEPMLNPAGRSKVPEFKDRQARERADFFAITGSVSGKGTLEQAVRMLAMLESQPWIHRVDGFAMRPIGKERENIEFSATVTTTFAPGLDPKRAPGERIWIDVPAETMVACQPIVSKNVFREPPAATAVAAGAAPPPPPPQPSGPAYADWRVTAVVDGRAGAELWLINQRTGETRSLGPGAELIGVTFVSGRGEVARVRIGQEMFEVRLGSTLADRSPASQ